MSPELHGQRATMLALLCRWQATRAEPMPAETEAAVQAAFARAGLAATPDVVALYATAGGMLNMDNDYWRLWPLAEIEDQTPSEHGVVFGDYCISCWEYRLRPASATTCAVYVDHGDRPPLLIAASLGEFLDRLLHEPTALLDAGAARRPG